MVRVYDAAMRDRAIETAIARVAETTEHGLDAVALWREVSSIVTPLVPNFTGPCCYTLDPGSLLITSHFNPSLYYELPEDMLRSEYSEPDVHDLASVARSDRGISTIHEAAGGDPSTSARWRANMELGGDQELLVALRARSGATWGCLGLYRAPGEPLFSRREIGFLSAIAPLVADGLRRALLVGEARDPEGPDGPGLVVLTRDLEIASVTPDAERWMGELPGARAGGPLPAAVAAVAQAAMQQEPGSAERAVSRVMSDSGRWLMLDGAPFRIGRERCAAVIIEPAHPARIASLLMAAYGLTDREQEITRLVLRGASTAGIASELTISRHTVQEHLKNVFAKTGVRSRRDLVGQIFFSHYEPRLRDNERRVVAAQPLRGAPRAG